MKRFAIRRTASVVVAVAALACCRRPSVSAVEEAADRRRLHEMEEHRRFRDLE